MKNDFDGLREKLTEVSFPSVYMFKFIVKSDLKKIAQIESLFHSERAQITRKRSSKGAFMSIIVIFYINCKPNCDFKWSIVQNLL